MKAPGPERLRAGLRNPLVIFPLLVMLAMATLVLFDLNGSSVGLLGVGYKHDASLLHGTLRGIRSDEFSLSTPYFVGNTRRGLPTTPWVGLTATFLPATSIGVPSVHWSEFFKPQDWGVFILGVISNGLNIVGVATYYQYVVKGLLLIFAVGLDAQLRKRQRS